MQACATVTEVEGNVQAKQSLLKILKVINESKQTIWPLHLICKFVFPNSKKIFVY